MAKRLRDHASLAHPREIPFEVILQIAEYVYDFKAFKALGLTCRFFAISLLIVVVGHPETPINRFLNRTQNRFIETLEFYYQTQYELALMYSDVRSAYEYITHTLLRWDLIFRQKDIRSFTEVTDGKYPLKYANKDVSVKDLFHVTQGLPNIGNMTQNKCLFFTRIDKLLRQCYHATLIISDECMNHTSPYPHIHAGMLLYLKPYHPDLCVV